MKNEIIINTFADVIKKCLYKVSKVQSDNECRKIIFDELNNFFRSKTSISFSLDDNIKNYALAILDKKNQDILKIFNCNDSYDNNNKYSVVNVEEHLENLKKTIEAIDDKNGYGDEVLTRYLKAYTECSKKVVLNKSLLDINDVKDFEYEARCSVFQNIPPLDDKKDRHRVLDEFLNKMGFDKNKPANDGNRGSRLFGIVKE